MAEMTREAVSCFNIFLNTVQHRRVGIFLSVPLKYRMPS